MQYSKQLRMKYVGKIEFIYISIDQDFTTWQEASQEEGLSVYSNSYLLLDYKNSPLNRQFNLSAIPRYVIINKDGKIIDGDAPRPQEKILTSEFYELIKE